MPDHAEIVSLIRDEFALRNRTSAEYIPALCEPLARASQEMAQRFLRGGRLLAVGSGPYVTDAAHISVEFVHPVIVGKRALPALDLSLAPRTVGVLARESDIVMGFGPPAGDPALAEIIAAAAERGALTCLWPGHIGRFQLPVASADPFVHQEMTEIMYHTLWETVHVFFEHEGRADDVGAAAFLYPFLGPRQQESGATLTDVAASIGQKARDDERLRTDFAQQHAGALADAALAIHERLSAGGTLLAFGNGGSATDATDLVLDCVDPPAGMRPIGAVSLAMEPANISAIANDVGVELVFLRQLIAGGRSQDVAVAVSTSGKSKNICAALVEARKRGMLTIALLGGDGGDIVREKIADHALVVHCDYIPRIQEVQASIYHILRRVLAALDKHGR